MTRRRDLAWGFVLAVAVHGAAIVGINGLLPADRPPAVLSIEPGEISVEIAFLPPPAPAAARAPAPVEPEPEPAAPAPVPAPAAPAPAPAPVAAPPAPAPQDVAAVALPEPVDVRAPAPAGDLPQAPASQVVSPAQAPALQAVDRSGAGDAAGPGMDVPQPTALSAIAPHYPRRARLRGEQGRVSVTAEVTAEGRATSARIAASSGSPALDAAAAAAVESARFQPAQRNGRPVAGAITLEFVFRLTD